MTISVRPREQAREQTPGTYPDNPVLVRIWRGDQVESQHRGAWVVTDPAGRVEASAGHADAPVFTRSAVKCLQALPLLETGAAQRFAFDDADVALALASHNAEPCHTDRIERTLARLGLATSDLRCGAQPPGDPEARQRLRDEGVAPTALHNNCSGKHAGFLALALHLDAPAATYLEPESPGQRLVRKAVTDLAGVAPDELGTAVDGCGAPTFRMPLTALATAFARVANPEGLAPLRRAACERMQRAVAQHPELIAGRHQRICTDIARITRGRLFPKIGSEAVYAIGVRGEGRALAIKIDDGTTRGMHALIVDLLRRFRFATPEELDALDAWAERRLRNWSGTETGRTEVVA
jgi:L-asparaginase II